MKILALVAALMAPGPPVINAAETTSIPTQGCDGLLGEYVSGWCPGTLKNGSVTAWDSMARVEFDVDRSTGDSIGYLYLQETGGSGVCPAAPSVPELMTEDENNRADDGYNIFPIDSLSRQFQMVYDIKPETEFCAYVFQNWEYNNSNILEVGPFTTTAVIQPDMNLQPHLRGNSAIGMAPGCLGHANDFWCTPITHLEADPESDKVVTAWGLFEDCGAGDPQVCGEIFESGNQQGTPGSSELNSLRLDFGTVNPAGSPTFFGQTINTHDEDTPRYHLIDRTPDNFPPEELTDTTEHYIPHSDQLNWPIEPTDVVQAHEGLACNTTANYPDREDDEGADCHHNTVGVNANGRPTGLLYSVWRAVNFETSSPSGGTQAVWDFTQPQPANMRGLNCTSETAAGTPYASMLITPGEIASDEPIRHMLALTGPNAWIEGSYIQWDGMHSAGGGTHHSDSAANTNYFPPGWDDNLHRRMPYGTVTRYIGPIPAGLTPGERKILIAWRDYGAMLMDGTHGRPNLAMTNDKLDAYSWVDTEVGLTHPLAFEFSVDFEWSLSMVEVVSPLNRAVPRGLCTRTQIIESPPITTAQCADGIDNDNDGLTDFPADPGCSSADDDDEFNAPVGSVAACGDGFDNDGDLLTDFPDDPGCTSLADTSEEDGPALPQVCTINEGSRNVIFDDAGMASAIGNVSFTVPSGIAATNNENNRKFLDGFIDASLFDGFNDGTTTYVVDPTGVEISTGIQYALDQAAISDTGVYVPDGTYLLDRALEVRTWASAKPIAPNCEKTNSPDAMVLLGESTLGTVFKLSDTPAFDFDNPNNMRPFIHWFRDHGTNCYDTPPGPRINNVEINGQIMRLHDANGFAGGFQSFSVDINGHVGAIGAHTAAAQGNIVENIHVFSSTGDRPGTAFGQLGNRTSGGKNLSAENVDLVFDFLLGDSNPGVVGCTARNFNTLARVGDRTPSEIVGCYVEYDQTSDTADYSLVTEMPGGFGGAANILEITDSVIYVLNEKTDRALFKWDQHNKQLTLRDVAVFGKTAGTPLVNLPGTADDVASKGDAVTGWEYLEEFHKSQPGPKSSPTTHGKDIRYSNFGGYVSIDGSTPVVGTTYVSGHVALQDPPINLWEKHWHMFTAHPFAPHTVSLMNDFCIPRRGERATGADIQAVIDAGYEYIYAGKGVWVLEDDKPLTLGANTKLFGLNHMYSRFLTNPDRVGANSVPEYLIETVADAEATTLLRGFSLYVEGRQGDTPPDLITNIVDGVPYYILPSADPQKVMGSVRWRAGRLSRLEWNRKRAWGGRHKRDQVYNPVADFFYDGPTAGGVIFSNTNIESAEGGRRVSDRNDYVAQKHVGTRQPTSQYGPNDEHKDAELNFHRELHDVHNYQSFGNKNECGIGFVGVFDSDNISISGHGVGCTPEDENRMPETTQVHDSTNIRLSNIMPHNWPLNLNLGNTGIYKNGVKTVDFAHGEGVGLMLDGDFDGSAFTHGNDCDTSSLWGTGTTLRPEINCPSLVGGGGTPPPLPQCSDGIDNDGDTLIDFPNDPGCDLADDDNETDEATTQCADGIDNDGDGLIDLADPGCINANDDNEFNASTGANLLAEPGFETSVSWAPGFNHVINEVNPRTGTKALELTSTGSGTQTTWSATVMLTPGTEYQLKANVAAQNLIATGGGSTPIMIVQHRSSQGALPLTDSIANTDGYRWAPYPSPTYSYTDSGMSLNFELAAAGDRVRVGARTWFVAPDNGNTSGKTWWDDFSLVEIDRSYRGAVAAVLTAETATSLTDVTLETTYNDYTGAGYLDVHADNGTAQWVSPVAGTFLPVARYSREGPNTKMWVSVNGVQVGAATRPEPTGRRGMFATVDLPEIAVAVGDTISIRLQKAGALEPSQPLLDKLTLHTVP